MPAAKRARVADLQSSPTDSLSNATPLDGTSAPLPFCSAIVAGRLANGLTYYIRPNAEPRARAELRLAVRVGSLSESEDELGIAHMIEHLAFRATVRADGSSSAPLFPRKHRRWHAPAARRRVSPLHRAASPSPPLHLTVLRQHVFADPPQASHENFEIVRFLDSIGAPFGPCQVRRRTAPVRRVLLLLMGAGVRDA